MSAERTEAASRVPAIDLTQAGPSDEQWGAVTAELPDFTWPSAARVIVVSPHPDDETLGAGGLIATAIDRRLAVTVVSVTDGEAAFAHPDLAALRRAELASALARLAPRMAIDHRRLGLPDGHVAASTSTLTRELVDTIGPGDLVVCPLPDDGHPDHAATARATVAAAALAGAGAVRCFPIWAWHCHDPATTVLRHGSRLVLTASALERKRAAIECFASQTSGLEPVVPPAMIQRLSQPLEVFVDPGERTVNVDLEAFDRRYREHADPWEFETSRYEQARYDTTLGWLGDRAYRRAFEPGCSIGVLTERLAARAASVVACDVSPTAIAAARRRVCDATGVTFEVAAIPQWWPEGSFDLIVFSEVGYYWDVPALRAVAGRLRRSLEPGGTLLAVHWLGNSSDHLQRGHEVHDVLRSVLGPSDVRADVEVGGRGSDPDESFTIERWTRP